MIKRVYKSFFSGNANISIPEGLNDVIIDFLNSRIAYESGFRSKAQVATVAVRNFLASNGYYSRSSRKQNHPSQNHPKVLS